MNKEFFCIKCEDVVQCKFDEDDDGYFCPLCGCRLPNEPDPDAVYDQMRDDEMFKKEEQDGEEILP